MNWVEKRQKGGGSSGTQKQPGSKKQEPGGNFGKGRKKKRKSEEVDIGGHEKCEGNSKKNGASYGGGLE